MKFTHAQAAFPFLFSLGSVAPALGVPAWKNKGTSCKIKDTTNVAIYVGGGTGPSSKLWAEAFIDFWKTGMKEPGGTEGLNGGVWAGDTTLEYATLTDAEFNACRSDLSKLDLFFMPGGSAYGIQDSLGADGKAALTTFLDNGGSYVGICAGGYYAARGYYWKGDDGAPVDNCKNQFCRYEVTGTFSFDSSTLSFDTHEWGGTSYHSDLLAYGPLANVLVEGPIEEIAGPWSSASDPNHPYDSHLISTDEEEEDIHLRAIYWGGATERYIYTNDTTPWGTEHAFFEQDTDANNDLDFPEDSALWSLKSVPTENGGTIMISSAHLEASLFHKSSGFDNGGMTECQQYNNYVYLIRKIKSEMPSMNFNVPEYDTGCSLDRSGEVKNTANLFPNGLVYRNAPRIGSANGNTGGGGGGGCASNSILLVDFEDDTIGLFVLTGDAQRPWVVDAAAACDNTSKGMRAGHSKGVDSVSKLTMSVPAGATQVTYYYSYPSALDSGDDFHVSVNGNVIKEYETGDGTTCGTDTIVVIENDMLEFTCKSRGIGETCAIDQIQFC